MCHVCATAGDSQLNFGTSPARAPDLQLSADTPRAFAHPFQTPVPGPPLPTNNTRIDTGSIIPDPDAKLPRRIKDFNFDSPRPRVLERVAQRFVRNPVHFILQDRIQVLCRTLDEHGKGSYLPRRSSVTSGQFYAQSLQSVRQGRS